MLSNNKFQDKQQSTSQQGSPPASCIVLNTAACLLAQAAREKTMDNQQCCTNICLLCKFHMSKVQNCWCECNQDLKLDFDDITGMSL